MERQAKLRSRSSVLGPFGRRFGANGVRFREHIGTQPALEAGVGAMGLRHSPIAQPEEVHSMGDRLNGNQDRMEGGLDELKGRGKEALGGLSGNEETQAEGQTDQVKGQGQQALGNLKDAAGNLMDKVKGSDNP